MKLEAICITLQFWVAAFVSLLILASWINRNTFHPTLREREREREWERVGERVGERLHRHMHIRQEFSSVGAMERTALEG